MPQPDLLASSDQRLGQVRDQLEQEPPLKLCRRGVHRVEDDAGGDVVHHDQPVDDVAVVLGEARGDPRPAVVADQRDSLVVEKTHQRKDVGAHRAHVVAAVGRERTLPIRPSGRQDLNLRPLDPQSVLDRSASPATCWSSSTRRGR